jgi:hypothetical protein
MCIDARSQTGSTLHAATSNVPYGSATIRAISTSSRRDVAPARSQT